MWQVLVVGFWCVAAVYCIGFVVFGPANYLGPVKSRQLFEKYRRFYAQTHPDQSGLPPKLWLGWYVDAMWAVLEKVCQNGCRYLANAALLTALVCVSLLRWSEDVETQANAQKFLDTLLPFSVVLYACHISGVVTRVERKLGDRRDETEV